MNFLRKLARGFRALFQKAKLDREMDEEMRAHLELRTQANIKAGMPPEEARYAAQRSFGGMEQVKEMCRDLRGVGWIEIFWQDVRFGLRMLRKSPSFTAAALLTLALGIGATTAIVSVVKIAVFNPLPVSHPDRFLQLGHVDEKQGWSAGTYGSVLQDARQQTNLFAYVAAYHWDTLTLPGEDFPEPVPGMWVWVTPDFFRLWSVRPWLGRTFTADEGKTGKDDMFVISYRLWQHKFGGDPAIVGRTVFFRERPMIVVGVMPPHFAFPNADYDYWRPVEKPDSATGPYRSLLQYGPNLRVIAETQPGIEPAEVQAFMDVLTERQRQEKAPLSNTFSLQARDLREMFSTLELSRTLGLLLGIVVFVLLIASANIANLQLARTETRQQELATRAAMGAGRVRVFRQLLTESMLLAVMGGTVGLAVTVLGLDLLQKLIPASLPRLRPITLNMGVLGVAASVTLSTGLLFGLAPALRGWRLDLSKVLKLGAATGTRDRGRGRFSQALIVGQLALVLTLLAGAGLMIRTVMGLLRVNPGLDPKHVVRVYARTIELQNRHYNPDPALNRATEAGFAFFADARERVAAIPGVTAVGVGIEGQEAEVTAIPGAPPTLLKKYWVGVAEADPLRVLRVPLRQGRWLDRNDLGGRGVLVNEMAARRLWPGEVAVGKLLWAKKWGTDLTYEVVGVVGDTRDYSSNVAPQPTFYRLLQKEPEMDTGGKFLVFRSAVDPVSLYRPICQALKTAGADPEMPHFINLHEALWNRMAGHRALTLYLSIFAGVGLFLAAIGLYGVLAYSVARRMREIGIRVALGAQISDVMRLILRQGLALVVTGSVLGIAVALATGKVLRAYLFGVSSTDPLTFIAVTLLLAAVALFACWLPARQAVKVNPIEALRHE